MKCERCGKEFPSKYYFATSTLCTECFQTVQAKSTSNKMMQCPECKSQLLEKREAGITIDECEKCSGIWFDAGELEAYRVAKGGNKDTAEKTILHFKPSSQSKILTCPRCNTESLIFGDLDKFQIARCDKCFGVFVNEQEIQKMSRHKKFRSGDDDEGEDKFWIGASVLEFIGDQHKRDHQHLCGYKFCHLIKREQSNIELYWMFPQLLLSTNR